MRRATAIAVLLLAALALAACGDSPEDEARDDGKQIGEAVRNLFDSSSREEAEAAVDELRAAVDEVAGETRERVQDQVDTQRATLQKAADEFRAGDVEGLKAAVQQIRAQADSFRSGDDSIANEFWRGFEEGYEGE
jgi:hypothetical protein